MDVKRLVQSRADKVFQHVGKVEKDKTFPDRVASTSKWLVAEHRLHYGCEAVMLAVQLFLMK